MRRFLLAVLAAVALAVPVAVVPTAAQAATRIPPQVGLVSYVASGLTSTGATLTFNWAPVKYATKYDIIVSTSFTGVQKSNKVTLTTKRTTATITRLKKNTAYFVQVRPVNSAGKWGLRSFRVGHVTMAAQPSAQAQSTMTPYNVMTWNICNENTCSAFASRQSAIVSRISELSPDIAGLQESDALTTTISGYNTPALRGLSILYKTSVFAPVSVGSSQASGRIHFTDVTTTAGEGVSWQALRDTRTGRYVVVFNTHLHNGRDAVMNAQRQAEARQLLTNIDQVMATLRTTYGSVTNWDAAAQIMLGDFNWTRTRTYDSTGSILTNAGWYDSFEQARTLSRQHLNSANPSMLSTPPIGVTWGDHIDQVRVKPGLMAVTSWTNAALMTGNKYTTPLASDHNPVLVTVKY